MSRVQPKSRREHAAAHPLHAKAFIRQDSPDHPNYTSNIPAPVSKKVPIIVEDPPSASDSAGSNDDAEEVTEDDDVQEVPEGMVLDGGESIVEVHKKSKAILKADFIDQLEEWKSAVGASTVNEWLRPATPKRKAVAAPSSSSRSSKKPTPADSKS